MDNLTTANKKLEGKIAIITGGASGIGEATARLFAQHGAKVVIADIQEEKGRSVAESIGVYCSFIKCDVSDEKQVQSLMKTTLKIHGRLDIMFSNAGISSTIYDDEQVMLGFSLDNLDKIMSINVRGSAACVKYAAEAMVEGGVKGKIICTGSSVTLMGTNVHIDYAMSKYALLGLVTCASLGLGKYGIRVNCVTPGVVATPLYEKTFKMSLEQTEKMFERFSCLKNNGVQKARSIADAVLFLASDDSQFVTGQNLVVDGESFKKSAYKLSKPLISDDGKVYMCSEKNLVAFESNGSVVWMLSLNYKCSQSIVPVLGESRKARLQA